MIPPVVAVDSHAECYLYSVSLYPAHNYLLHIVSPQHRCPPWNRAARLDNMPSGATTHRNVTIQNVVQGERGIRVSQLVPSALCLLFYNYGPLLGSLECMSFADQDVLNPPP